MNLDDYIKSCMEVREKESQQKNEVLSAIKKLIEAQGGDIYIPYMFDEDDYDEEDYNQLVEDEYLVSIGNILTDENDNLEVDGWVETCFREEEAITIQVVGIILDCYGNVSVVSPSQNIYSITDSSMLDILDLCQTLKKLGYELD